jgi:hypothetical protein
MFSFAPGVRQSITLIICAWSTGVHRVSKRVDRSGSRRAHDRRLKRFSGGWFLTERRRPSAGTTTCQLPTIARTPPWNQSKHGLGGLA